jgi:hypothetical protein
MCHSDVSTDTTLSPKPCISGFQRSLSTAAIDVFKTRYVDKRIYARALMGDKGLN